MKPRVVGGGGSRALVVAAPRSRRHERRRATHGTARSAQGDGSGGEGEEKGSPPSTSGESPPPRPPPQDPEKRWRRLWGGNPHGVYRVPGVSDWFARAPQVRVRSRTDRQLEQLADLAVVNERLAGGSGSQARARVDFLRGRRRLWARIYDVVTRSDVGATLGEIERATGEVRGALEVRRGDPDGASPSPSPQQHQQRDRLTEREKLGVSALRERLVSLQEQLREATERIESSRVRLGHNEERLRTLKAAQDELEAALARAAERDKRASAAAEATSAPPPPPPPARGSWFPLAFLSDLDGARGPTRMVPLDVDGAPWVLFRTGLLSPTATPATPSGGGGGGDDGGGIVGTAETAATTTDIACIRDECAHRACPLSLGTVDAAGRAVCPYHGWCYDGASGACVEMPSTLHRRGVGVEAMKVGVRDGVVWGWRRRREDGDPPPSFAHVPLAPPSPPPASAATPDGYKVVAEATATSETAPDELRAQLAAGRAHLARGVPESAAARGLLPPPLSSSSSADASPPAAPPETFDDGVSAVVTLTKNGKGTVPPPPTLRLVHLVSPSKETKERSRLLLRVCVADNGSGAEVYGAGKRRLWAALAAEAVAEDARLGSGGEEGAAAVESEERVETEARL